MSYKGLDKRCILVYEAGKHANVPRLLTNPMIETLNMATCHFTELNPLQQGRTSGLAQDFNWKSIYGLYLSANGPARTEAISA